MLTTPPREKKMFSNIHMARCFLWRQNNPEVNYSPTRISGGGVFLEEAPRSRQQMGDMAAESKSYIIATQGQALPTKYIASEILQTETDSKCALCSPMRQKRPPYFRMLSTGKTTIYKATRYNLFSSTTYVLKKVGIKFYNKLWCERLPISVEITHETKVDVCRINK